MNLADLRELHYLLIVLSDFILNSERSQSSFDGESLYVLPGFS